MSPASRLAPPPAAGILARAVRPHGPELVATALPRLERADVVLVRVRGRLDRGTWNHASGTQATLRVAVCLGEERVTFIKSTLGAGREEPLAVECDVSIVALSPGDAVVTGALAVGLGPATTVREVLRGGEAPTLSVVADLETSRLGATFQVDRAEIELSPGVRAS